jgi:carbamoylphosphate synthase large subunit
VRRVRGVLLREVADPRVDAAASVDDVCRVLEQDDVDLLLPLDDEMVRVGALAAGRIDVPMQPRGSGDVGLDKRVQLAAARRAGLCVPPTVVVEQEADWPEHPELPLIVKPALAVEAVGEGLGRQGAMVCREPAGFERARQVLRPPLLIQPLLQGTGIGVFGSVRGKTIDDWSAHERVRMMNPQGSGASTSRSTEVRPDLVPGISAMLGEAEWSGMFMIEFLRDAAGVNWFMELNGRAWGSMALACRRGFAYPAWTVQYALGLPQCPEVPDPSSAAPMRCRHLGREIIHLAFVARGRPSEPSWPRLGRTLLDMSAVTRRDRAYNYRAGEPLVLLADTWQTVHAKFRARKRPQ